MSPVIAVRETTFKAHGQNLNHYNKVLTLQKREAEPSAEIFAEKPFKGNVVHVWQKTDPKFKI